MSSENYVPINVDVLRATSRAIQVRCADNVPRWIPLSLIFGPDEKTVRKNIGQLIRIRVFEWFAEKNFIPRARG